MAIQSAGRRQQLHQEDVLVGWRGFRMPLRLVDDSLPVDEKYIHYLGSRAKNDNGKDLRSVTPAGFARAVFLANATQD